MRKLFLLWISCCPILQLQAQGSDSTLTETVKKHILFLASDSLKGRGNYTRELHRAADYIAAAYKSAGLASLAGISGYFQPFTTRKVPEGALLPDSTGCYQPQHVLLNVIGVLPGRTRPAEVVIFSAHYDHLGVIKAGRDSILNGANDNASGTAALLALARYYALQNNNERTLLFVAFSGEELGLRGASFFSDYIHADAISAMINMEMIGRTGAAGKNAFFITGGAYSNLEDIMKKNLSGSGIRVRNEPDVQKSLFRRSDNFPFAKKGVPAHTVMSSDDDDACYHRPCDEIKHINLPNLTGIIRAIIKGSATIISGADTPRRISKEELND